VRQDGKSSVAVSAAGDYQIRMAIASERARAAPPAGQANGAIEWQSSPAPVPYPEAVAAMEARVAAIRAGSAPELVWLLEHPALYTAGTSARDVDLVAPDLFPVYRSGRGGQYTYHGPGQRIAYVMLDLKRRGGDIRRYVYTLEAWLILALARFGVTGERRQGRVGIWVGGTDAAGIKTESKIAAIGVRVRQWVSYHGIALNVAPDLAHYRGIVPCGVSDHGVTSLAALGVTAGMAEVDAVLRQTFAETFGQG
jgi:lipoyl(octanoyl) transferase